MSARNARDLAYHTVRSRIITMELKPGDPLNDRELAEELGISRTPMREALILLNNAHMVAIKPQSGTHVAPIDLHLMELEQFSRYTLEKEILTRMCGRLTPEQEAGYRQLIEAYRVLEASPEEPDREMRLLELEQVRPFFASGVWQRIAAARQVLREEPFITALPAGEVVPEAAGQGRAAKAPVLVQGIADVVLVFDDHAEILDYKTDKSRNATYYIESYAAQLRLYRRAFALRLPVPVTKLTIYSFAMQDEIDIPLEYAAFGIGDKLLGR